MGSWVPIGPEQIIDIYEGHPVYSTGPYSGRATVITSNPQNPNEVWLGTATGGVWHSVDVNAPDYQWVPMLDNASSLSIGAILLEHCSSQRCETAWVGTGENNIRRDTYYGTGLYKLIWDPNQNDYVSSTIGDTEERFKYGSIVDIKRLGSALYIAVSKGKSASSSETIITSPAPQGGYGIHRSSDEGSTWINISGDLSDSLPSDMPSDMEIQAGSLLVGFHGKGIYRLTTGDVWCPLGPSANIPQTCPPVSSILPDPSQVIFDHVELAISPANDNLIYAAYGQCGSELYLCEYDAASDKYIYISPLFFVSRDGGASWSSTGIPVPTATATPIETYSRYTNTLIVDGGNPGAVYYGGTSLWRMPNNISFISDLYATGRKTHEDIQDLIFPDPNALTTAYIATDGGFYVGPPLSAVARNHGLATIQFQSACASNQKGIRQLMGGTQDTGTVMYNGSPVWEQILVGDGGDCIIAQNDMYYGSYQNGALQKAIGNASFVNFQSFGGGELPGTEGGIVVDDTRLLFPPFLMHDVTRDFYFGANRLYMRGENDTQWVPASPIFDTSTQTYPEIEKLNTISAISLSQSDPNIVYVALYNGDIWVSKELGPCVDLSCWTQIGGTSMDTGLPASVPTSLDVDPGSEDIVYVTYSDFSNTPKVWRSLDGGGSWESFSQGLPNNVPVKIIRVKPDEPNIIYLGTDIGVFRRNLIGDLIIGGMSFAIGWQHYTLASGLPSVPVYDIVFDTANNLTYAATHGRGMYMLADEGVGYVITSFAGKDSTQPYVFGHAFSQSKRATCSVEYLNQKGEFLARTSSDRRGGAITVDDIGRLVSTNAEKFGHSNMVAICMDAQCFDSSEVGSTLNVSDITQLKLVCGTDKARVDVRHTPTLHQNPTSTLFSVRKLDDKAFGRIFLTVFPVGYVPAKQEMQIVAEAEFRPQDTGPDVLEKLVNSFNSNASDKLSEYHASLVAQESSENEGTDEQNAYPGILIENPDIQAMQLFTGFEAHPGEVSGIAFDLQSIGLYGRGEMIAVKTTFSTLDSGAEGGYIIFAHQSLVGLCRYSLDTVRGQTSEQIAENLYNALERMKYPGTAQCASRYNAFDLQLQKDSVITFSALGISVEINDPGVGIAVAPFAANN